MDIWTDMERAEEAIDRLYFISVPDYLETGPKLPDVETLRSRLLALLYTLRRCKTRATQYPMHHEA